MTMHVRILRASWRRGGALAVLVLGVAGLTGSVLRAADPPEPESASRADAFLKLAQSEANGYILTPADSNEPLELIAQPILRWTNPEVGEIYGGVFVWTRQGRPEVVASLFKWYSPFTHRTHEFQSLSEAGVEAVRDGDAVWSTTEPGVTFRAVPGGPAPAQSEAQRLRQMKQIASRFTATVTDADYGTKNLRLLSQPLMRYGDGGDELLDGALFGFVVATDPELLLVLEARQLPAGGAEWQYGFARLEFKELNAAYRGEHVWTGPKLESREIYSGRHPYVKFSFKDNPAPAGDAAE